MSGDFADHTLLVTTYDRPGFLRQLLDFVCARGPIGTILVADASCDTVKATNAQAIARLRAQSGVPIEHRLLDHDLSVIGLHVAGIEAVETPFMTFVSDDDFILTDAVRRSVTFLRDNPGHVACAGRFGFVSVAGQEVVATLGLNAPIEGDDPLQRFIRLFDAYWSVDFATWRTDVKRACCAAFDVFALDEALGEPLHGLCAALHGKVHVVDGLSTMRTRHDGNNALRNLERRLLFTRPVFREAFDLMAAMVRQSLAAAGRPEPTDLEQQLMEALLRHIADNRVYFRNRIGFAIVQGLRPGLAAAKLEPILAWMRQAFDEQFLGADAPAFRAAHEAARQAKAVRPGLRDDRLITLTQDRLVLHAPAKTDETRDDVPSPAVSLAGRIFAAHAEVLLRGDFHAGYEALRRQVATRFADVLGPHADILTDALFIVMIAEDVGVHIGANGDALAAIMNRLDLGSGQAPSQAEALGEMCVAMRDRADGRASGPADRTLAAPRPLAERPVAQTRPLPGAVRVADAQRVRDVTLIPLALPPGEHVDLWVHARLRVLRGSMQLCLMRGDRMVWHATAWPTETPADYYLPVIGDDPEWIVLRDVAASTEPAHAQVEDLQVVGATRDEQSRMIA